MFPRITAMTTGRDQGMKQCASQYLLLCCMLLHALQALQPALNKLPTADGTVPCAQRMDTGQIPSSTTCSMRKLSSSYFKLLQERAADDDEKEVFEAMEANQQHITQPNGHRGIKLTRLMSGVQATVATGHPACTRPDWHDGTSAIFLYNSHSTTSCTQAGGSGEPQLACQVVDLHSAAACRGRPPRRAGRHCPAAIVHSWALLHRTSGSPGCQACKTPHAVCIWFARQIPFLTLCVISHNHPGHRLLHHQQQMAAGDFCCQSQCLQAALARQSWGYSS